MKRSALLLPLLAGCYNYSAIQPASAPAGMEVRARISGAASDRVAPILGTFDTRELSGTVVENSNGAMVLEVPTGAIPNTGSSIIQLHQRVPLTPADITLLETRRLDRGRTVLLTGVIAAGVAVGANVALHAFGHASQAAPGDDGPPVTRIPVLRFRF